MNFFKSLGEQFKAVDLDNQADRLEKELGNDTNGASHKLRVQAHFHRLEADIIDGKVKAANSEDAGL